MTSATPDAIAPLRWQLEGRITRLGYDMPLNATLDEWVEDGRVLGEAHELSRLALGDWLNLGSRAFPDKYEGFADVTGLAAHTLENYAYVSRNVDRSRRRESVPFSIYAEVAPLEPEVQAELINRAAADPESVTVQGLREFKNQRKGRESVETITVHKREHERLLEIARNCKAFIETGDTAYMDAAATLIAEQEGKVGLL